VGENVLIDCNNINNIANNNNNNQSVDVSSDNNNSKGIDFNNFDITNVLTNSNLSQSLELRELNKFPRRVRCKQVDLLTPNYLTAKLNNERVINIKHPSLWPRVKPNRNPSQVSSSFLSSNDEDSFLSDSDNDSKSDSSVFSSDSHVSEEKTDCVN
jgi:hypothetical protein